jgi:AbrB family looped-hinge helix DNA binding protein
MTPIWQSGASRSETQSSLEQISTISGAREAPFFYGRRRVKLGGMNSTRHEGRITSGGRITIPSEVRRLLGVGPGDRLVFETAGESITVRASKPPVSFEEYRGIIPELPRGRRNVLRYMRELRGR